MLLRDLTTNEVAARLGVCGGTVRRLIDSGSLKGYRVPNSLFRRVREVDLQAFIKEHDWGCTHAQENA